MESIPNALRVVATQFEQLLRGNPNNGPGGGLAAAGSTSVLTGLLNQGGASPADAAQTLSSGLAGSLMGGLVGGGAGEGAASSALVTNGLSGSALDGALQGPLGFLARSLFA
ncbi:MAG: hypothetical protein MUF01_06440, partial [Bryobacterales bacterium]|nr:hypothetical protein [Bryobacterales bacterium]